MVKVDRYQLLSSPVALRELSIPGRCRCQIDLKRTIVTPSEIHDEQIRRWDSQKRHAASPTDYRPDALDQRCPRQGRIRKIMSARDQTGRMQIQSPSRHFGMGSSRSMTAVKLRS